MSTTLLAPTSPLHGLTVSASHSVVSENERQLGAWTRFHAYCSCRCSDLTRLSKTSIPSDSQPLYYFQRYPCRRAEIVGLVIGIAFVGSSISYFVDDGTAVVECTLPVASYVPVDVFDRKGKRKMDEDSAAKPGWSVELAFRVGSLVRVLGHIAESGATEDRFLRIEEIGKLSRLSEELRHARKAKTLRLGTYAAALDVASAWQQVTLTIAGAPSVAEINARFAATHATSSRSARFSRIAKGRRLSAAPAADACPPTHLPESALLRPPAHLAALHPALKKDEAYSMEMDSCFEAGVEFIETSAPASQCRVISQASARPKARARLHAPHQLKDEQLHDDIFFTYLYDYFYRHSTETITHRQLYYSRNFAPLARRIVKKLVAEASAKMQTGSVGVNQLVSEMVRLNQKSETMAVDCLYLRSLNKLCSSMYIAPSPTTNDAYELVTTTTVGPTLLAMLRIRPRTPHELVSVMRRGEDRWRWARTERVQSLLEEMEMEGMVKALKDGRWTAHTNDG